MQQYELAESFFQKALHLTETVFGEYSKQAGKMNYLLAECYWNQSKMDEAQPYCEKSLAIRERILGGHHLEVAMSLCGLGGTQPEFNSTSRKPSTHPQEQFSCGCVSYLIYSPAEIWMERDDEKAKPLIERALAIRVSHFGEGHPLVARCLQDLAVIADNAGFTDKAVELVQRAISVRERTLGALHPHLAASFEALASIYKLADRPSEAEVAIRRALHIYKTVYGEEHTSVRLDR
jgi:tetratricopeptide (TPR) repeat protein